MPPRAASADRPSSPTISRDLLGIADLVHRDFDGRLDPQAVDECLTRVAAKFDNARVRSFVPLLVRRYVGDELKERVENA